MKNEKVFIEEIDGVFFAFKVENLGMSTDMDSLAKSFQDKGYEVRIGGNLSQFE